MPIVTVHAEKGTTASRPAMTKGSSLCTECGLCCTGALHDRAVLDPDEIAHAETLGLPVRTSDRPVFALPCPQLAGTFCSIYSVRPRVCARYKCQLLLDFEDGVVNLEEAMGKVRVAKELSDRAQALMPEGIGFPEARALFHKEGSGPTALAGTNKFARLKLAITLFSLYLDRNFRKDKEDDLLVMEPVKLNRRTKAS